MITGGTGFIGSHLVKKLQEHGMPVILYPQDVRKPFTVNEELSCIIHLAAIFTPRKTKSEYEVYETNIRGTLNALECSKEKKAKFIFMSTCAVYGDQKKETAEESDERNPNNAYGRSKSLGEDLCKAYSEEHGVSCIILRVFNCYGPGQQKKFFIPMAINALNVKNTLRLQRKATTRDYVYVDDVVEAIIKAVDYRGKETTFNIGTGKSWRVDEVVKLIEQVNGKKLDYEFDETKIVNINKSKANIEKAKQELGWIAKIDLSKGIQKILITN